MKKLKGLVCLVLVISVIFAVSPIANALEYGSYLEAMLDFMTEMYYEGITEEEALTAAQVCFLNWMIIRYIMIGRNPSLLNSLNNHQNGATLETHDNGILIVDIFEDSPAEKYGLQAGDIVIEVDDKTVVGMDAASVAVLIRGEAGTEVRLTITRNGLKKELSIIRGSIINKTVNYRIEGRIGYISINSFDRGTSKEFNEAIEEINKAGIKKIILDIRGNSGGYVDEAVAVARKLIPRGIVTTLDYKSEKFSDQVYYSYGNHPKYIIAVLVDENTASASEILAGAIEDSGIGFLVGQKTFGKGVFQNIFSLLHIINIKSTAKNMSLMSVDDISGFPVKMSYRHANSQPAITLPLKAGPLTGWDLNLY